jgi:hypothetical protein
MHGTSRWNGASRRGLQVLIGVMGLVPVTGGLAGMLRGAVGARPPVSVALDSDVRFLSTLLLGAGLVLYWCIPRVERRTLPLRAVCAIVMLGGCARLLSIAVIGPPTPDVVVGLAAEIAGPAIIVAWQAGVAASTRRLEPRG